MKIKSSFARLLLPVLILGFLFLVPSESALADLPFFKKSAKKKTDDPVQQPKRQGILHPPFRNSPWGDFPHPGLADDPGQGYRHYDHRARHYGHWYQPKLFGLTKAERCAPMPFKPRGYGNLFNRPSNCYRVDYHRYVLIDHRTDYGPSYYHNVPDPRCKTIYKGDCNDD